MDKKAVIYAKARAKAYLEKNILHKAMRIYKLILKKVPDDYDSNNNLGIIYAETFMPVDAFRHFFRAIAAQKVKGEAWINMGVVFERFGKLNEAKIAYETAFLLKGTEEAAKDKIEKIGTVKKSLISFVQSASDLVL
ncbi:unnamed protein product [Blepharisma stoltei]|uniref:Tetratricopeptide repeat protein n=1 Tax=Blepharisma stoltei TaxID=1481888 RepID=A0AAU9ICA3_9CILI|nr:unnamed protein product [Blepharisma stoltei]